MHDPALFKWRHFEVDIILCAVRWYLRYALRYRDVEELLRERGVGSITSRSFIGPNAMLPDWRNAAIPYGKRQAIPTARMSPIDTVGE